MSPSSSSPGVTPAITALLLALTTACGGPPAAVRPACTPDSIIVRTGEALGSVEDVESLLATAAAQGVESVAVLVKVDEDEPERISGYAFYASDIAPIAPGYADFDAVEATVRIAHARGMRVVAWIPQFHDAAGLLVDPSWSMEVLRDGEVVPYVGGNGERFLSPADPGARAYELSILEEVVTRYDVDGVMLDWVRYDGWNTGMEAATRDGFMRESGIDARTIDMSADSPAREQWRAYRAGLIASHVHEARQLLERVRPDVPLGVYVLPLEFIETSQDAALFAADIDLLSPMLYFDDWSFSPEWVATSTRAFRERVGPGVPVIPVLDEDWSDAQYTTVLTELGALEPPVTRVGWFAYGAWDDALISRLAQPVVCQPTR
jgi:uncharacterized lipoprotein YddW (UPF0748 family)